MVVAMTCLHGALIIVDRERIDAPTRNDIVEYCECGYCSHDLKRGRVDELQWYPYRPPSEEWLTRRLKALGIRDR